jgi:prevent-host-death family protein
VEVAVTTFRANLSQWLERAREGEEVVVTDRGVPIARLLGINATATIERLTAQGVIGRPQNPERPQARGRARVRARRPIAPLVSEQRR